MKTVKGDITKMNVDVIVNAANCTLLGGGGVDGAIHRAAGSQLLKACMILGGCATGCAKVTEGYNLPAKHIIHTVGPIYHQERHEECRQYLAQCYLNSLDLAEKIHASSIAFPNISTGAYGFPKEAACKVALSAVVSWFERHPKTEIDVYFVCFDDENFSIYKKETEKNIDMGNKA